MEATASEPPGSEHGSHTNGRGVSGGGHRLRVGRQKTRRLRAQAAAGTSPQPFWRSEGNPSSWDEKMETSLSGFSEDDKPNNSEHRRSAPQHIASSAVNNLKKVAEVPESSFLPKVIGVACPPMLFHSHPFFKVCSEEFRDALIRHTHRQHFDRDHLQQQTFQMMRNAGVLAELFDQRDELKDMLMLTVQGERPPSSCDGLHLTFPEESHEVEVLFNNIALSDQREAFPFGAEIATGLCQRAAFTVRVRREPLQGMYFLPREALVGLLNEQRFASDAKALREMTEQTMGNLLHMWHVRNSSKVKIRLFANMCISFRHQLIQSATIRLCSAGQTFRRKGTVAQTCFCVFQGDADVFHEGTKLLRLSNTGSQAWHAWWGFLETLGTSDVECRSPATVTAVTDCVLWEFSGAVLAELRSRFPAECSFLDKVAVKHVQMLAPHARGIMNLSFLRDADVAFVEALSKSLQQQTGLPGDAVIQQHEAGHELFVLVWGFCSVYRGVKPDFVASLSEGASFGELALLGITSTWNTTVRCDTVCDIRVLGRSALLETLDRFSLEAARLDRVAQAYGHSRKVASAEIARMELFRKCSEDFLALVSKNLYQQAILAGQMVFRQDQPMFNLHAVVHGAMDFYFEDDHSMHLTAPLVFGEISLLMPGKRCPCSCKATTICDSLSVCTQDLSAELHNKFPEDMARVLACYEGTVRSDKHFVHGPPTESARVSEKPCQKSFLHNCDPDFLHELSQSLTRHIFFDGQVLIREGVDGKEGYIVEKGTCRVEANGSLVGQVGAGSVLGEKVICGQRSCFSSSAQSVGVVVAYSISRADVAKCLERFPQEGRQPGPMAGRKAMRGAVRKMQMVGVTGLQRRRQQASVADSGGKVMPASPATSNPKASALSRLRGVLKQNAQEQLVADDTLPHQRSAGQSWRKAAIAHPAGLKHLEEDRDPAHGRSKSFESSGYSSSGEDELQIQLLQEDRNNGQVGNVRRKWPGIEDKQRWLKKRQEALQRAEAHRQLREWGVPQRKRPELGLPPIHSARDCRSQSPVATAQLAQSAPQSARLRKLEGVYSRPVWGEIFGAPIPVE